VRKGTPNVNCKYGRSPLPAHLLIVICWTIAHACLVDLQALLVTASLKGDGPTNYKLQASSGKLRRFAHVQIKMHMHNAALTEGERYEKEKTNVGKCNSSC
jgi:hypothetical protein